MRCGVVKLKQLRSACARCGCKLTKDEKLVVGRRFRAAPAQLQAAGVELRARAPRRGEEEEEEEEADDENQQPVNYRQFLFYVLRRHARPQYR